MGKTLITASMVARSHGLAEPHWSPSGERIAWLDAFDGRADVVVAPVDGSGPAVTVTGDVAVAPAGAYGGGTFCWADDDHLVVAAADGRLVVVAAAGGVLRTLVRDGRAFAPAVSSRGEVACCIEREDACDVAIVPLDGSAWPVRISDADYAWDPAFSPDGALLAWHEWDVTNMPWDGSRIAVHDRATGKTAIVAGGPSTAVGQPRFSPDGRALAFVSDATGWMNVHVANLVGSDARPVLDEEHEHAESSWGPGQRSFAWSPDGAEVAWCRNERGLASLVVGAPDRLSARVLSKGWHQGIDWSTGGLLALRSGAVTPTQLVVLAPNGSGRRSIARGPVGGFERAGLVEPRPVGWKSNGAAIAGLLYRPARSALGDGPPPLYVHIHGGPTGQSTAAWSPRIQFFVERGWAVLAPDYRGSSGYGRAYAQSLAGRWGERDVADVAAGIRHAGREGWCDPDRVAVVGGSAGGLTVLLLCALHGDIVRAGVSLFGVTDLFELAATTHRFESRYLDRIVGLLPADAARYRERSPLTHAADIRVPLLVLQGSEDRAVPAPQAEALVDAMRRAGRAVEYQLYEGEGHGWRRASTIEDELTRSETFLRKHVLER